LSDLEITSASADWTSGSERGRRPAGRRSDDRQQLGNW